VYLMGIMPRCGTSYLFDLLCAHPHCGAAGSIHEDYLICYADSLFRYVEQVAGHWNPRWGPVDAAKKQLGEHLGRGLASFLRAQGSTECVVAKTPRIDNLDRFFDLLPNARLLILVRDGRAVVESGIQSFRWPREAAVRKWAECAEAILDFDRAHRGSGHRYLIVRYEDLWTNQEAELRRVFGFLELEPDFYDYASAADQPVRGSSTVRNQGDGTLHWKPMPRTSDFDPMSRWQHWSDGRHLHFNWVAGRALAQLGYTLEHPELPGPFRTLWYRTQDIGWAVARPFLRWWTGY